MTSYADQVILVLIRTTAALSVGAGIAWLLLKILRVRSPRTHRLVWLVVLIQGWLFWRITLPILPAKPPEVASSPTRTTAVSGNNAPAHHRVSHNNSENGLRPAVIPNQPSDDVERFAVAGSDGAADGTASESIPLAVVPLGMWCVGIILLVLRFALRYVHFVRELRLATPAPREWRVEWDSILKAAKIKDDIPLLMHSSGPLLCRMPRSYRLLVPSELWGSLTPSRRRLILLHELAHYRRGDVWKSLLVRVLLVPHWFNPLAWLAVRRFDEAAEWECDDVVRRECSQHVPEYARTLLELAAGQPRTAAYSPAAGAHALASRIRRLFNPLNSEDRLMKRLTVFTLVIALALFGVIAIGPADANGPSVAGAGITSAPDAKHRPKHGKPARPSPKGSSSDHLPTTTARRKFKIDEAVIDPDYIFKKVMRFPQYKRQQQQLKKEFAAYNKGFQERSKPIQEIKRRINHERDRNKQIALKRRLLELEAALMSHEKQSRKLEQKEYRMWSDIYGKIRAEVVRYAKEKDIRVVKRIKPKEITGVVEEMTRDVIYQAKQAEPVDITKPVLERLTKTRR